MYTTGEVLTQTEIDQIVNNAVSDLSTTVNNNLSLDGVAAEENSGIHFTSLTRDNSVLNTLHVDNTIDVIRRFSDSVHNETSDLEDRVHELETQVKNLTGILEKITGCLPKEYLGTYNLKNELNFR